MFPFDLVVVDAATIVDSEGARAAADAQHSPGTIMWDLAYARALAPAKGAFRLLAWLKQLEIEVFLVSDDPEKYAETFQRLWVTDLVACGAFSHGVTELSASVGKTRVLTIGVDEARVDSRATSMAIHIQPLEPMSVRARAMTFPSLEAVAKVLEQLHDGLEGFRGVCRAMGMETDLTDLGSLSVKFDLGEDDGEAEPVRVVAITGNRKAPCEVAERRPDTWCLVEQASRVPIINTDTAPADRDVHCEHPCAVVAVINTWEESYDIPTLPITATLAEIVSHDEVTVADAVTVVGRDCIGDLQMYLHKVFAWDIFPSMIADMACKQLAVLCPGKTVEHADNSYSLQKLLLCGPVSVRFKYFREDCMDAFQVYGTDVPIGMVEHEGKIYLVADSLEEIMLMQSAMDNNRYVHDHRDDAGPPHPITVANARKILAQKGKFYTD